MENVETDYQVREKLKSLSIDGKMGVQGPGTQGEKAGGEDPRGGEVFKEIVQMSPLEDDIKRIKETLKNVATISKCRTKVNSIGWVNIMSGGGKESFGENIVQHSSSI